MELLILSLYSSSGSFLGLTHTTSQGHYSIVGERGAYDFVGVYGSNVAISLSFHSHGPLIRDRTFLLIAAILSPSRKVAAVGKFLHK